MSQDKKDIYDKLIARYESHADDSVQQKLLTGYVYPPFPNLSYPLNGTDIERTRIAHEFYDALARKLYGEGIVSAPKLISSLMSSILNRVASELRVDYVRKAWSGSGGSLVHEFNYSMPSFTVRHVGSPNMPMSDIVQPASYDEALKILEEETKDAKSNQ